MKLADDGFQFLKDGILAVAKGDKRFLHDRGIVKCRKAIQGAGADIFLYGMLQKEAGIVFKKRAAKFSGIVCHGGLP